MDNQVLLLALRRVFLKLKQDWPNDVERLLEALDLLRRASERLGELVAEIAGGAFVRWTLFPDAMCSCFVFSLTWMAGDIADCGFMVDRDSYQLTVRIMVLIARSCLFDHFIARTHCGLDMGEADEVLHMTPVPFAAALCLKVFRTTTP